MNIDLDNLCFDKSIISECIEEMKEPITNRKRFFNSLVEQRLNKCNDSYLDEFEKELDKIESSLDSDNSETFVLKTAPVIIRKLSRFTNKLYKTELTLYKALCKGDK